MWFSETLVSYFLVHGTVGTIVLAFSSLLLNSASNLRRNFRRDQDPHPFLEHTSIGSKQKGPAKQVAPRVSPLKIRRFWVCVFPIIPWRSMTPKDPFLEGLSGTNSGGRFAPGRFCSLPKVSHPPLQTGTACHASLTIAELSDRCGASRAQRRSLAPARHLPNASFHVHLSGVIRPKRCARFARMGWIANAPALYRGQNPQNGEKRASGSKNPHFSPTRKRAVWVRKSPFSMWCPVEKWGFFDSNWVIRANRTFEWFVQIGLTHYKNRGFNCEWFARIDSRESRCKSQETLTLRFRSCFLNVGTYGLALVNQIFDSDLCLAGVPLRMMFANYESTFSKPRMDKNKTTNPFSQNYEKVLDCSRSHISKLRIRISRLGTEIFKLRLEVLNLEFSDYERTKNPATKPIFAWAKNNHEITKLAGVQYAACSVRITRATKMFTMRTGLAISRWIQMSSLVVEIRRGRRAQARGNSNCES